MRDVLLAQVAVLEAQIAIFRRMVEALPLPVPTVTISLPERCAGVRPEHCALQEPDARIDRATLADPQAWQCAGCRYQESSRGVM